MQSFGSDSEERRRRWLDQSGTPWLPLSTAVRLTVQEISEHGESLAVAISSSAWNHYPSLWTGAEVSFDAARRAWSDACDLLRVWLQEAKSEVAVGAAGPISGDHWARSHVDWWSGKLGNHTEVLIERAWLIAKLKRHIASLTSPIQPTRLNERKAAERIAAALRDDVSLTKASAAQIAGISDRSRAFTERIWPEARKAAGLPERAPAGRKPAA